MQYENMHFSFIFIFLFFIYFLLFHLFSISWNILFLDFDKHFMVFIFFFFLHFFGVWDSVEIINANIRLKYWFVKTEC